MEKSEARRSKLDERDNLAEPLLKMLSDRICERLLSLEEYRGAETVLIYASYGSEVNTDRIIKSSLDLGKRVALPVSYIEKDTKNSVMEFYYYDGSTPLVPGFKGIMEPDISDGAYPVDNMDGCIMIMPGVAFDTCCHRVGYGKGFYDRYLSHHLVRSIALAYEIQLCDEIIKCDDNDYSPDIVLTEKNIYRRV